MTHKLALIWPEKILKFEYHKVFLERICTFIAVFKCFFFQNWFCVFLLFCSNNWQAWRRLVPNRKWISFSTCENFFGILAKTEFHLLGWFWSWYARFEETHLYVPLKEHQDILQKSLILLFFCSVWFWKSDLGLNLVFETEQVLVFLHFKKVYLLLTTLRVFSDHGSLFLLIVPVNCLRELYWYHLQSDLEYFRHERRSLI